MADRELVAVVVLGGAVYGPGYINPPPSDVAAFIRNPAAWGDPVPGKDADEEPAATEPTEPGPSVSDPSPAPTPEEVEDPTPVEAPAFIEAPPRSGKGSGLPAWKAYADHYKVSYPADAQREDIIDACEAAGLI